MLRNAIICALIALPPCVGLPAIAQTGSTVDNPALRINLAGRQRMLSQRMAKAACLMAQEIDTTSAFDQMTQAYTLFSDSDVALRDGSVDLGLTPQTNSDLVGAMQRIDEHWANYSSIVQAAISDGTVENGELMSLDESSLKVLKFMNIAVYKTARSYGNGSGNIDPGLAITIDIAGRQRMLTQRAVKAACIMRIAEDAQAYADDIASTTELFHSSLLALQDGFEDIGVVAPPNQEVARKLREVAELWQPVKELLNNAADGKILSDRDLSTLARDAEPLLQTMNEAVGLYALDDPNG